MKPREFWITFGTHVTLVDTAPPRADQIIKPIRAVEKDALDTAIEALKNIADPTRRMAYLTAETNLEVCEQIARQALLDLGEE